ncbi:small G protein signaling modulator 1-like [Glandiceps talaboti]
MVRGNIEGNDELRQKLLRTVKKEVKQIMEEAVTRKFVHEDSGSIRSLCAAVDSCLTHGLKKRVGGLLKSYTAAALFKQVAKNFPPALQVAQKVAEIETEIENAQKKNSDSSRPTMILSPLIHKHLWIKAALFEKHLAKIIEHLVENHIKYYEKEALVSDPVDGPILASLLVGPCALDYSKMKTPDHYWTDPPADELVQRHRIHSSNPTLNQPQSPKRPSLQINKRGASTTSDEGRVPMSARDYVESLHQNSKTTLLYGKNNVLVQPKEDIEPLPGYLSLHQSADGLTIKWTPNQLMNGCSEDSESDTDKRLIKNLFRKRNGYRVLYWDYAVTVHLDEIVYLHCHQQPDSGGTIVLVGQDGVQRPPIHFPKGGHLLAFLSCLENGLLPHGQLDPPLWSQRGKGKVFPKLKRKSSQNNIPKVQDDTQLFEGEEATDYVFRIVSTYRPEYVPQELVDPKATNGKFSFMPWASKDPIPRHKLIRSPATTSSTSISPTSAPYYTSPQMSDMTASGSPTRASIRLLCDTMKKQIISRAFYGWLAHCRHLHTVRTHLSGLVHHSIISQDTPCDAMEGLTVERWKALQVDGKVTNEDELFRLVYFGGMTHEIRKEVWPYLLGHYHFGWQEEERTQHEEAVRQAYEQTMTEWLAVEAIVRQRDREIQAANLAKLSSDNSLDGQIPLHREASQDPDLENDVFEGDDGEYLQNGTVSEIVKLNDSDNEAENKEVMEIMQEIPTSRHTDIPPSKSPRQDTLETESGRSLSENIEDVEEISQESSPHGSDEGIGHLCRSVAEDEEEENGNNSSESCHSYKTDREVNIKKGNLINGDRAGIQPIEVNTFSGSTDKDDTEDSNFEKGEQGALNVPDSLDASGHLSADSAAVSPVSSSGGVYATELLDCFGLNLHRIEKDVQRCDRNYYYFTPANLDKLRNVMCTYVWEHLDVGYVQGMCDLVAPLLVIFDDEAKTYSCFCELMKRMAKNFPHGGAMDSHFANMRSLIQILDSEMFELMHQNGDYTHFYFCYRWFLLDFKRELVYDDTFSIWETIWAAKHVASSYFVLFIALALVEYYRDIILDNNMDFTDIIKFFNEMAERHDAKAVLKIARDLVFKLQNLIENK